MAPIASELDFQPAVRALPAAPALTLLGVPVRLELSCVFAFALASWTIADAMLPEAAPGHSARAYWTGGTTAGLLLLTSLGVHELAHGLAARRAGLRVRDITLSIFGGAIALTEQPRTPGEELRIAVAGPAANIGLAGIAVVAHVALVELGADPLSAAVAAFVALFNFGIAAFNVIPAAPLDGGRILGALLWRVTGQRGVAGRMLDMVGRSVGAAFLGLCLLSSASGDAGIALWSGLIGLVLWHEGTRPANRRVALQG
jgi:Zn-dependent protease